MKLEDRLSLVMGRQHELLQELHRAQADVAVQRSRLLVRLADVENRERYLRRHYQDALDEGDPQAERLREWPEREYARAEEIKASMAELDAVLERLLERIEAVAGAMQDLRELQPLLVARVVAARSAGLGREVFDALNDALTYVELALAAGTGKDDDDGDDGPAPVPAVV
jgi:chromosome segregation ATPase